MKNETYGPHLFYIYIYNKGRTNIFFHLANVFIFFIFFIFSRFSLRYTEIRPSEFVGARNKVLYSTRATHGNQKHGISPSFQLKIRKIICFGLSQIYDFLTVGIGRSRRQNQFTHRELRVGTKILEFRQTPRGMDFRLNTYINSKYVNEYVCE